MIEACSPGERDGAAITDIADGDARRDERRLR
jgi:hypothetical protein